MFKENEYVNSFMIRSRFLVKPISISKISLFLRIKKPQKSSLKAEDSQRKIC